ncbi:MAG TPA: pyridoxamine 5'-phosphate oxidase family protein [Burkholderiaceae bacterium]|jgi:hypothetical protein
MNASPFHAGEQALQTAVGMRERMEQVGRSVIRNHMPEQHRELYEKLPVMWLGTLDKHGQPWATAVTGAPGFVDTPDPQTLTVAAQLAESDPAAAGLKPGAAVGMLGLEPHTRRRNRMNGLISEIDGQGFAVSVVQSFGNCPRFIQARQPIAGAPHRPGAASAEGSVLSAAARRLIERADTFFIASSSAPQIEQAGQGGAGVDVSHRGGPPGFVQILSTASGDTLTLPDYQGNVMFNTLGNLLLWPHAGLLFVDWETGDVLQLAASAEIHAVTEAQVEGQPIVQSRLSLKIEQGWWRPAALPVSWTAPVPAPQFLKN